jgi:hypothetical protein
VYYNVRLRGTDSRGAITSQGFTLRVTSPFAYIATASKFQATPTEYNPPQHTLDGNLTTRWAAESVNGAKEWIQYDLREDKFVTAVQIALFNGYSRKSFFDIQVSADGENCKEVFKCDNRGTTSNC